MQPFYFGTSQQQLFGVYHSAEPGTPRRGSVVLCHPLGHEYLRAHRAFRNLAAALAGQGFHVLRFDYFGTGDSAGEPDQTTIEQCLEDVATAIDELKDIAGSSKVSLVGLRLGATMATMVAAGRRDIDRIVLWDPVLDGTAYIADLFALQRRWLADRLGGSAAIDDEDSQLIGYPVTTEIRRGLESARLAAPSTIRANAVSLFVSDDHESFQALHRELATTKNGGPYNLVPGSGDWRNGELVHEILLPHAMIRAITTAMSA
jgi:uncharacterized protein